MNSPVICAYRRFGDIPFVAVLTLLAAMTAVRALSDWQGPAGSLTNDLYIPSLMMGHGHGLVNVEPADVPGLRAFLDFQEMTFPANLLPDNLQFQPLDVYQQYHQYLIWTVGAAWRCFGVSWDVVRGVCVLFYVLTVLLIYGVARLAMRRPFAATVAAAFIASPAPLVILPTLRDFAKAPFIIATLIILGTIIVRPRRTRWFWAMCALLGLVIGIGLGFRRDLMVFLLPAGLVPLVCARPPMRVAIMERLAGAALMLAAFFLAAWPILKSFQEHGTLGYHDMIMGLATVSDDNAGLSRASYERIYVLHDLYASETAMSFAERTNDSAVFMEKYRLYPDRAKRDFLVAMACTFPGDIITRSWGAVAQVLSGVPTYSKSPNALWVLLAAATLLCMAGRNLRLAAFVAFFLAYYAGVTSLQYLYRHSFHLAFAPYWFAGLSADWILATVRARRRSDPRRNLLEDALRPRQWQGRSLRNTAIFAGAAVLIIAAPLHVARYIQMRQVDALVAQCAAAELQPVEMSARNDPAGRLYCPMKPLALRPEGPLWEEKTFLTSYVVLDFDISGHVPCFSVLYEGIHDFSHKLTAYPDYLPGEGAIRYFLPVYESVDLRRWSRFRGILLPDDSGLELRAMHTVRHIGAFGLIMNIGIPEPPLAMRRSQQIQWRQKDVNPCFVPYGESYHQQLRRRAREMASSGANAEALHLLQEAAQVEPWRMETVLELAALQEKAGDTDAAQRNLEMLLSANPHEPVAANALDDFFERRGGLRARVAGWRAITESSPGSSCAWHFLGKALLTAGDRSVAQEALRRALALNPELLYGSAVYLHAFSDTLEQLFEEFHVDRRRSACVTVLE